MTNRILRSVPRAYVPPRDDDGWCVVGEPPDRPQECDDAMMELDDYWQRLGDVAAGVVEKLAMRTGRAK